MSDEISQTVTLKKPIEFNGQHYYTLTLQEPTLDQFDQASKQKSNFDAVAVLLAAISGVPTAAIRKLGARDLQECSKFLDAFTLDSPATGNSLPQT